MEKETLQYIKRVAFLALAYFISGKIGLSFHAVSGFATYFWIPTGISIATLLIFGYRLFPGILIGAFLVNFTAGASFQLALAIALGNTFEALTAVFLLRKTDFNRSLASHNDVLKLAFFGALLSTLISASFGVLSLYLSRSINPSLVPTAWFAWWIGDMVSVILYTPVILLWIYGVRAELSKMKNLELAALFGCVILTGVVIFGGVHGLDVSHPLLGLGMRGYTRIIYLVFPLLIWSAIRFDQKMTASAVLVFSLISIVGTGLGNGPFRDLNLFVNLYLLQTFIGITSVTSMLLAVAFEETREADRKKNDFVSIVSHELKNPISAINGYVQLLEKSMSTRKNSRNALYFKRIDQQSEKLMRMVNDLLNLSRIQTNTFEIKPKRISFKDLVEKVVDDIQITSKNHNIAIKANPDRKIYADEEKLEQVMINLVSNAIKYSPDRKKIFVESRALRNKIQFSVTDHGIGISERHGRKIFDLFYRTSESPKFPGLGIGLYFSRHIIKQHGGEIWYRSDKKHGTTFYFTVPYKRRLK